MKVYQITATGTAAFFNSRKTIRSKNLYKSMEEAQKHIDEFIKSACTIADDVKSLVSLDSNYEVRCEIIELELVD